MLFKFENISYNLAQNRIINASGQVSAGHTLVLQGASGTGKSTLLRIFAKLQAPTSGVCYLEDNSWDYYSPVTWRKNVHYISQKPAIFEGSVLDNLKLPFQTKLMHEERQQFNEELAFELMDLLKLSEEISKQDAKTLSGGEAARIAFIRALLINPKTILLDEPTAALDQALRKIFYSVLEDWLQQDSHCAILVSHIDDYKTLSNTSILKIS